MKNSGSKPATLQDVSQQTGLSPATVSRVLNSSPNVRASTRMKVLDAVSKLGYTINHTARSLKRQRTDTICVISHNIASGYYSEALKGINEIAALHKMHLMVAFALGAEDEPSLVNRYLSGGMTDGMILMNPLMDDTRIRQFADGGFPLVLMNRVVKRAKVSSVTLDNRGGADAAMTYLIGCGYARIAVIRGPDTFDSNERWKGCSEAAERAGYNLNPLLVWHGGFDEASGYRLMKNWLMSGQPLPDAVFAFNDAMAIGVLSAMEEHDLRMPEDIALVGFDDVTAARHLKLTTVRSPMREMGRTAALSMINLITGDTTYRQEVLPSELITRGRPARSGSR